MTHYSANSLPANDKAHPETAALFVSDVHLQASMPLTTKAFFDFLQQRATRTSALYLLGDLFEYWAGDDDIEDSFNQQVVDALRQVSDTGVKVYWIAGNRDFLAGNEFAKQASLTLLTEPFVITIGGKRIVLAHGDAQCTDDVAYMAFRAKIRDANTQKEFLSMPLAQRKLMIANMREGSREAQRTKSYEIMDVNADAIRSLFDETSASIMIHGHTHRPARHEYAEQNRVRYVLPDWDCEGEQVRGGWLGIDESGSITRYDVHGQAE